MVSKAQIKHIRSLALGKFRRQHQQFVAEGHKIVEEMLLTGGFKYQLYISESQTENLSSVIKSASYEVISEKVMKQISQLTTPPGVLAVVDFTTHNYELDDLKSEISLILDGIRDPGNLGSIIRSAEWFGIQNIFISADTVDPYHPKVVQATMGSLFRVRLMEADLITLINDAQTNGFQVFAAVMDGKSVYKTKLTTKASFLVIGSESHGINKKLRTLIKNPISIPSYARGSLKTESLNASVAAAVLLAEFRKYGD
ncbi:MAG: RNA methyltransferase [Bacteroidales bacterium]|jgi:TrmH family RNA methyltransferase|nr:RNA methyltransferase [Bacteroidales bacterium]